jgi:hypothetical protein
MRRLGGNLLVSGRGYLGLSPIYGFGATIREVTREGHPAVLDLHPCELAVNEVTKLKR